MGAGTSAPGTPGSAGPKQIAAIHTVTVASSSVGRLGVTLSKAFLDSGQKQCEVKRQHSSPWGLPGKAGCGEPRGAGGRRSGSSKSEAPVPLSRPPGGANAKNFLTGAGVRVPTGPLPRRRPGAAVGQRRGLVASPSGRRCRAGRPAAALGPVGCVAGRVDRGCAPWTRPRWASLRARPASTRAVRRPPSVGGAGRPARPARRCGAV